MNLKKLRSIISGPTFTGGLLFFAAVAAFVWANISPETYNAVGNQPLTFHLGKHVEKALENGQVVEHVSYFMTLHLKSLQLLVSDLLMVIFFFSVGLEIKGEFIAGKLSTFSKAILPIAAALGGMVFPALLYFCFNHSASDIAGQGWGIPMATDIAFSLAVISLLAQRVPLSLKIFLMTLAVADDLGGIAVIAFFYTEHLDTGALAVALLGTGFLFLANMVNTRTKWVYYVVGFAVVWTQILESGVHATIAGILMGFAFPTNAGMLPKQYAAKAQKILDQLKDKGHESLFRGMPDADTSDAYFEMHQLTKRAESPLASVERTLAPFVALVVMPVFALANAGVNISGDLSFTQAIAAPVALGVGIGLLVGKPVGIFLFTLLFVKLGIGKLPDGVKWKHIFGMGIIAGMGFTVALFITELAFRTTDLSVRSLAANYMSEAKLAILLASVLAAIIGYVLLYAISGKQKGKGRPRSKKI